MGAFEVKSLPVCLAWSRWRGEVARENQLGQLRSVGLDLHWNSQAQGGFLQKFFLAAGSFWEAEQELPCIGKPDFDLGPERVLAAAARRRCEDAAISSLEYRAEIN